MIFSALTELFSYAGFQQNVEDDTGKLAASVAKERELSVKMVSDLAKNISLFKNTPMNVSSKDDP